MIALVVGLVLDFFVGDPMGWPHPVVGIGKLIKHFEKRLYPFKYKKIGGGLLVLLVLLSISVVILSLRGLLKATPLALLLFDSYGFFSALAFKSLMDASKSVRSELEKNNLKTAREKIAMFVSRETEKLSEVQVIKTLIETISENTVDGILSPLFYGIVGQLLFGQGVLFIWLYKGINTMDSMIAYKNDRYMDFGFVAAKVDDVANFIPARLSGPILLFAGWLNRLPVKKGFQILKRDHQKSVSPNAGYPESVTAGLLGVSLGGDYPYFGKVVHKPIIGVDEGVLNFIQLKQLETLVYTMHISTFMSIVLLLWVISY